MSYASDLEAEARMHPKHLRIVQQQEPEAQIVKPVEGAINRFQSPDPTATVQKSAVEIGTTRNRMRTPHRRGRYQSILANEGRRRGMVRTHRAKRAEAERIAR